MEFPGPEPKKRFFYRCMSRETIVKLRKILVTGISIYFVTSRLQEFMCPDHIKEIESYKTVYTVLHDKYAETLEYYLMNNSEYYHLTQIHVVNPDEISKRFIRLLHDKYLHFVRLEDTKEWDAELTMEMKNNFYTRSEDQFREDKMLLYKVQEMVVRKLDYQPYLFMEMGMTDMLRNYSTQALTIWYHWRGMIVETDLATLDHYVSQPVHTTVLTTATLCPHDEIGFHYFAVDKRLVREEYRNHYNFIYRVPCFPLTYFGKLYRTEHIEYVILGPRSDLMNDLYVILKHEKVHFVLIVLEQKTDPTESMRYMESKSFTVYFSSRNNINTNFNYFLYYRFIERKIDTIDMIMD